MKTILIMLAATSIFIAGCAAQEKTPAQKEQEAMTLRMQKAADDLNEQIDTLSASIKSATAVLKEEMPEISKKIQNLVTELQQASQQIQESIAKEEMTSDSGK